MAKPIVGTLPMLQGKRIMLAGKFPPAIKNRVLEMISAYGGTVVDALDATVHHLVTQDGNLSSTLEARINALRKKGVALEPMDLQAFMNLVAPTAEQLTSLIAAGPAGMAVLKSAVADEAFYKGSDDGANCPRGVVRDASFDAMDLTDFDLSGLRFERCSFKNCNVTRAGFSGVYDCDFSGVSGESARFFKIDRSRFVGANLPRVKINSHLDGADFTRARLDDARLRESFWASAVQPRPAPAGPIFRDATLRGARFDSLRAASATFEGADLSRARLAGCRLENADFRRVVARSTLLMNCCLTGADFAGAALSNANFATSNLKHADFSGASLDNCNVRLADINDAQFPAAFDIEKASAKASQAKSLSELDAAVGGNVEMTLHIENIDGEQHEITFTVYGSNAYTHFHADKGLHLSVKENTFANVLQNAGDAFAGYKVDFGRLLVKCKGTPIPQAQFQELMVRCVSEVFRQDPPESQAMASAQAAHRKAVEAEKAAERKRKAEEKDAAAKAATAQKKKAAKSIEKQVSKITDTATFLKALELRIEAAKISKATSMLKKSGFQLYNDVTADFMSGVVKSQTDADLVYACRIKSDGSYSCCTQNLNVCGGLRGSICKHLLVLIIGLVQAEKLDPNTIDGWVAKSNTTKPVLDKEIMGEIFIRYKGAEAGEVDWRPTETLPEDYYAL